MAKPQTLRLQFSLRALLAVMALVGVSIVVYRWPWTVEVNGTRARTTTQLHRAWNGKPVRHGMEVEQTHYGQRLTWKRWFQEGQLLKESCFKAGALVGEKHFRGGKQHGPWWGEDDDRRIEGEYFQDQEHGEWKDIRPGLIRIENYQYGKLHGRTEWRTPDGRLLQSAEYEQSHLVKWNGRDVQEDLRRWVDANVTDAELRRMIMTPITHPSDIVSRDGYFGETVYYVTGRGNLFVQRRTTLYARSGATRVGNTLGEAILAESLVASHTFAYRFNMLHIVPINAVSLDWQDRTGVYDMQFEPDSQQAKAWLQPVTARVFLRIYPGERFQEMFAPESETGIVIDTDTIIDPPPFDVSVGSDPGPYSGFRRCDLLDLHLDREGCYCEQRGNRLIIKRHP